MKCDYYEAEEEHRSILLMRCRIHCKDADHPDIARSLYRLVRILQLKRNYDGDEEEYRCGLFMRRRIHGEHAENPGIAASLHKLWMIPVEPIDFALH